MEKTAINELIDDIKENNRHHYEANIIWFKKLIDKEKQQIIDAYEAGVWDNGCKSSDSDKYFKDTYVNGNNSN